METICDKEGRLISERLERGSRGDREGIERGSRDFRREDAFATPGMSAEHCNQMRVQTLKLERFKLKVFLNFTWWACDSQVVSFTIRVNS